MAEVCISINGGTADIHTHMWGVQGFERLLAAREAVINV
jgi:hypothetical protein